MSLTNELIKGLLSEEENKQTTAVYAGGFKPPTGGHFEVVQQALKQNPEIDEFIIFIGNKERNGISQEESLLIWEIYNNYLPFKVKIEPTSKPPIKAVYNLASDHPTREVLWVIGAREGNEEDFKDITSRTKSISKYPNLELRTIITSGGVSGTAARNASKISLDKFKKFVPDVLSDKETEEVYNIVADKILENKPQDGKALPYGSGYNKVDEVLDPKTFNYKPLLKSLTKSMEGDGLKLQPYPKVTFIHDEEANANDFFGMTAYYDPNNNEVVLYTLGRHPKDIMRSYAHELIHVHQNHEDRLKGINTSNVNEDDYLKKIEREAYEKGNISFRSWTNNLNEAIVGEKIECDNCDWSWDIVSGGDDLFVCHKCGHDNEPINEKKLKDPFGINAYARELALLREEKGNYKIYLDMDGVIADFNTRFKDLSGIEPKEFESKYGRKAFWDFIDEENKIKFWVGIPPMPGASELVSYVSKHDYEILTAPSIKKQSRLGKNLWVRNHVGDIFPSKPKVTFKFSKEKHKVKQNLSQFDILIDDRQSIINSWNNAGGFGILYQSTPQAIADLKKLGL
ncbi:hypothetical protein N9Z86_00590 [bacterium]|nr:hypothetical protein [bacterium]